MCICRGTAIVSIKSSGNFEICESITASKVALVPLKFPQVMESYLAPPKVKVEIIVGDSLGLSSTSPTLSTSSPAPSAQGSDFSVYMTITKLESLPDNEDKCGADDSTKMYCLDFENQLSAQSNCYYGIELAGSPLEPRVESHRCRTMSRQVSTFI